MRTIINLSIYNVSRKFKENIVKIMATIVSGFINLYAFESRSHKSLEQYIDCAEQLLQVPVNKIIFIESSLYSTFSKYINDHTKLIEFNREDMWLWNHRDTISTCKMPNIRNTKKDTAEYMMIQIQKTDWVRRAIELDYFHTSQFIWVDFGIYKIINDKSKFYNSIQSMISKQYLNVRIPGCWNLENSKRFTVNNVIWYFCGGLFGGYKDKLLEFDKLVKNYVIELIEKRIWTWEVNVWYAIYKDNKTLFNWYSAVHSVSMLQNY